MGEPMAARIVRAGFELAVLDLREEPMARLGQLGAHPAESARDLARRSRIVLAAVVDEAQVESLLVGPQPRCQPGLLADLAPGSIVVVHSTINPDTCQRMADLCRAQRIGFLDAPVTGGPAGAEAGTLALLVGGDAADLETCRPVFEVIGERIFHLGGPGRGQVAKIANNIALATNLQAVHEAVEFGRSLGVEPDLLLDILRSGAGDSWAARNWSAIGVSARGYPGGVEGVARLTTKDLSMALRLAEKAGLELPVTELTAHRLVAAYSGAARFATPSPIAADR
jgi:3-hydroxyisobutyrate dehydrogenase-like beta-hydroxyacid dehydrogenase